MDLPKDTQNFIKSKVANLIIAFGAAFVDILSRILLGN